MHELRQGGGYGWGSGEMGVGLNVPGCQHRGSDMMSILKGEPGSSCLYPRRERRSDTDNKGRGDKQES